MSCPPTQWLVKPKQTKRTEARAVPSPLVPAPQWLPNTTTTKRTEDKSEPSTFVPATTVAG